MRASRSPRRGARWAAGALTYSSRGSAPDRSNSSSRPETCMPGAGCPYRCQYIPMNTSLCARYCWYTSRGGYGRAPRRSLRRLSARRSVHPSGSGDRLTRRSAPLDDHLAGGQAILHGPVRLNDLVEAEYPHGLGLVPPGLSLGDHLLQRDLGQREVLGAEHKRAAVEAELDAGGQVSDRVEVSHRL